MKKTFTLTLFIFFSLFAVAQRPAWQWAVGTGGTGYAQIDCMTHDLNGMIYVVGEFQGTVDLEPNPNYTANVTAAGYTDIFICQYDSNGVLYRSCSIGGPGDDIPTSITVDANDNVTIAGYFTDSIDVNPDTNFAYTLVPQGISSSFILHLDPYFNFNWVMPYYSTGTIAINSLGIDNSMGLNSFLLCGTFNGTADLDPSSGIFNLTSSPNSNAFVSSIDSVGNFLIAYQFNSTFSNATSIVQNNHNYYISGFFKDTIDLDPGPGVHTVIDDSTMNSFVVCLDISYNYIWGRTIGGTGEIWSYSSAVDANSNVVLAGDLTGTIDLDPDSILTDNVTSAGFDDAFVVKLDSAGYLVWGGTIGSSGSDYCSSVAFSPSNDCYLTGYFSGTVDLDPGNGNSPASSTGGTDIFLVKLSSSNAFQWGQAIGNSNDDFAYAVTVNGDGNAYLGGGYKSHSISFDANTLTNVDTSTEDLFLSKLNSCRALYTLYPDTVPHIWFALDQSSGSQPMTYQWNWGDSTTSTGPNPVHTYSQPGNYNICLSITDNTGCSDTHCDSSTYIFRSNTNNSIISVTVVQQLALSVPEDQPSLHAIIFPNPASNKLTVSLPSDENTVVSIADLTGKVVRKTNSLSRTIDIDVSVLSTGIYLVHISNTHVDETLRIIIRR